MITQREKLGQRLIEYGWQLVGVEDSFLDWWADEIWVIESTWTPRGFRVHLTFLVDPGVESLAKRAQGQDVWAIGASVEMPEDRFAAGNLSLLTLGHGWLDRLPEFFQPLSEFRDRVSKVDS